MILMECRNCKRIFLRQTILQLQQLPYSISRVCLISTNSENGRLGRLGICVWLTPNSENGRFGRRQLCSRYSRGGGVRYIFWVRGRAIGKGIDFHHFGIRNGIDFHDFGIRNGIKFRNFHNWYRVGYAFSENGYKVGYMFLKNW